MQVIEKTFLLKVFVRACAFLAVAAGISLQSASAQDFSFKNQPILKAKTDANGVDLLSGSYLVSSPFNLNAPASSHLNLRTSFNGRRVTFNLNIYLVDDTYLPSYYSDASERHIRIHLGGPDKLFTCFDSGPCFASMENDGSTLTRETTWRYVYRDSDGTVYTFFEASLYGLPYCSNEELGTCNAAIYRADTYVSTIQYPNGEKLTYQPYLEALTVNGICSEGTTIKSNLGYKLIISNPATCGATPPAMQPGDAWQLYHYAGVGRRTVSLFKDSLLLSSISNEYTYSNANRDLFLRQKDIIGRSYRVDLHADPQTSCSSNPAASAPGDTGIAIDNTMLNPVFVLSPGGVQTNITYHSLFIPSGRPTGSRWYMSVPVKTVTRGGRTWNYDLRFDGKTATNPMGGTKVVTTSELGDPYSYGNQTAYTYCRLGLVGYNVTLEADELGRQTRYDYGRYTFEGILVESDSSYPSKVTLPDGDGIRYAYDARHNVTTVTQVPKPGSGFSERVIKQVHYDATCSNAKTCNQPNWAKDANGNQTDYTYSAIHGGVLTATAAADANGIRQRNYYTYESYNSGDGMLYRLVRTESCGLTATQMSLLACPALATTSVTINTYVGSTFLPMTVTQTDGAGTLAVTTTYTYNDHGSPTVLDGPRTDVDGRTYRTYDAVQRLIFEIGADPDGSGPLGRKITKHTYDEDNRELRTESGTGYNTDGSDFSVASYKQNIYDSAGLLVKTIVRQP